MQVRVSPVQRINGEEFQVPEVFDIPDGLSPEEQNEAVQAHVQRELLIAWMRKAKKS